MRTQLWLLVAFVAGHVVAAPAPAPSDEPRRSGRNTGKEVNYQVPGEDGVFVESEDEFDPEDVYGGVRSKRPFEAPEWEIFNGVKVTFDNQYPSYGTKNPSLFTKSIYNHGGIRKLYYDYSGSLKEWKIEYIDEKQARTVHKRALSDYRQFPKGASEEEVDQAKKLKDPKDKCPSFTDDSWKKSLGLGKGTIVKIDGAGVDAGMYNTEHVYEKQILGEFFRDLFAKRTKDEAEWFKEVATNSLFGLEGTSTDRWGRGAYYTFEICYWDSTKYKSIQQLWTKDEKNRPARQKFLPDTWLTGGAQDTLITALASVVGSNYRPDHLTLLEDGLNKYKGNMFSKSGHTKTKLKLWSDVRCIKNPFLLQTPKTLTEAAQDEVSLYRDRALTLRQGLLVWQYFELEWKRFASTSRAVYKLLKRFDQAYETLKGLKGTELKEKQKKVKKLSTKWQNRPGSDFNLATEYKEFLEKFMEDVISTAHAKMEEQKAWLKEADFALADGKSPVPEDPKYTTAKMFQDWDAHLKKYSKEKFWDKKLKQKLGECFEIDNNPDAAADPEVGECIPARDPDDVLAAGIGNLGV